MRNDRRLITIKEGEVVSPYYEEAEEGIIKELRRYARKEDKRRRFGLLHTIALFVTLGVVNVLGFYIINN